MTKIVGRERELATIQSFLDRCGRSPGALVIQGEPGAGKTTLWAEAVAMVSGDATLLTCQPVQAEAGFSYAGLTDLLGAVIEDLVDELPDPQRHALRAALLLGGDDGRRPDHRAVGAGTLSVLKTLAGRTRMVVAVDDLQWLDRPSGRALGFAIRRLSAEPVGFLASSRRERADEPPELAEVLRGAQVERISVGPLSLGALTHLVGDRLGVDLGRTAMRRIHEVSAGNPLFALELGRGLAASGEPPVPGDPLPLPEDLQTLLARRIRRLPTDARRALLLASLLTMPKEETLAGVVGPAWEGVLTSIRESGVADLVGGMLRFSHPLLASAIVTSATSAARQGAHLSLADAATDPEQRARHLALAASGADTSISAALEAAARHAASRGAPDAAADLAEMALTRTPDENSGEVFRRSMLAGTTRFDSGDLELAHRRFDEAVAAAMPGAERASALWRLARVRYEREDLAGAIAMLEVAATEAGDGAPARAAIELDLAVFSFGLTDLREALRHARAAAELAERAGTGVILARALAGVATLEFLAGGPLRRDVIDAPMESDERDEMYHYVADPRFFASHVLYAVDDFEAARSRLDAIHQELIDAGNESMVIYVGYRLAEMDFWVGDWERAATRAAAVAELAEATEQKGQGAHAWYARALVAAHRGDADDARRFVEAGVAAASATGNPFVLAMNLSALGFLEVSLGNTGRAVQVLLPLVDLARAGGLHEPAVLWFLPELIEALVVEGDLERAHSLTEWLDGRGRAIDRPRGLAGAARGRALIAAARGDTVQALQATDEALVHYDRVPVPFERARGLLVRGQIARRARKWGLARAALEEASSEFERLGATLWLERTRSELARIGGRAASRRELTETERQVAELAAVGRTNRQIAESLFVSPKTVSATLGRVYQKLDVTSRTALAARLTRPG